MERYIVSCFSAEEGGHFNAHRDNTTAGTAHRRFAVSINLNDDFDGGKVSFPEYGPRGYKAPACGAVVFSCSLLHKFSTVTRGSRYAFLPFLYDDVQQRNCGQGMRPLLCTRPVKQPDRHSWLRPGKATRSVPHRGNLARLAPKPQHFRLFWPTQRSIGLNFATITR